VSALCHPSRAEAEAREACAPHESQQAVEASVRPVGANVGPKDRAAAQVVDPIQAPIRAFARVPISMSRKNEHGVSREDSVILRAPSGLSDAHMIGYGVIPPPIVS
jgi:hypothetical protein